MLVELRWLSEVRSRNARRLHRIEPFDGSTFVLLRDKFFILIQEIFIHFAELK